MVFICWNQTNDQFDASSNSNTKSGDLHSSFDLLQQPRGVRGPQPQWWHTYTTLTHPYRSRIISDKTNLSCHQKKPSWITRKFPFDQYDQHPAPVPKRKQKKKREGKKILLLTARSTTLLLSTTTTRMEQYTTAQEIRMDTDAYPTNSAHHDIDHNLSRLKKEPLVN